MAAPHLVVGGGWWYRPNDQDYNPLSTSSLDTIISTDYFWPSPSSPQTSDLFHFPVWDKSTTDPPLRALEELYQERTYLIDTLQAQIQTASQLMRKIPILESRLLQPNQRASHRKIRKQLGWVKNRLGQSSQQEQTITARLDQLASEILRREQWDHVEREQQKKRCEIFQREQVLGYQQGFCDAMQTSRKAMNFDPEQPDFRPRGSFPGVFWPPLSQQQQQQQHKQGNDECQREDPSYYHPRLSVRTSDEKASEESTRCESALDIYKTYTCRSRRSASLDGVDFRLFANNHLLVAASPAKRHSFPGCSDFSTPVSKEHAHGEGEIEQEIVLSRRISRQASVG